MLRLTLARMCLLGRVVSQLPDVPYTLPGKAQGFEAESSGAVQKEPFFEQAALLRKAIRNSVYAVGREALWRAPGFEAMEEVVRHMSYDAIARYAMEHAFYHLFYAMVLAADAPLPHVQYEDLMKCKTFGSLQQPPEEQFHLEPQLVRSLLCVAARHLLVDEAYFATAESWFRVMEQQQPAGSELLSGWMFCCASAGRIKDALIWAKRLDEHRLPLDGAVFCLLMHPHVDPQDHHRDDAGLVNRAAGNVAKGFLLQQRLRARLSSEYSSASVAVHALFTFYSLTCQHARKWNCLRHAVEMSIPLCDRTVALALAVYLEERGRRCGPKTTRVFVRAVAEHRSPLEVLLVLVRCRKTELQMASELQLPLTAFSDEDVEFVMTHVRRQVSKHPAAAFVEPAVEALLRGGEGDGAVSAAEAETRWKEWSLVWPRLQRGILQTQQSLSLPTDTSERIHDGPHEDGGARPLTTVSQTPPTSDASADSGDTALLTKIIRELTTRSGNKNQVTSTAVQLRSPRKRKSKLRRDLVLRQTGLREDRRTVVVVGNAVEGRTVANTIAASVHEADFMRSIRHNMEETLLNRQREESWRTAWINPDAELHR